MFPSSHRTSTAGVLLVLSAAIAAGVAGAASPRGSEPFIVFSSDYTPELLSNDVFSIAADGSDRRNVTRTSGVAEELLAASPTTEAVAFTRAKDVSVDDEWRSEESLWVTPLDGRPARRLWTTGLLDSSGGDKPYLRRPTWSPDGRFLAFEGRTATKGTALHVAAADGTRVVALAATGSFAWLPDSRVAYARPGNGRQPLYTARLDGTGEAALTSPGAGLYDDSPTVSPDGRRIAFRRTKFFPQPATTLLLLDLATGAVGVLVECVPGGCFAPAWSPTGARLAYATGFRSVIAGLSIVDIGTGVSTSTKIETPLSHDVPALVRWSADGARVALTLRSYSEATWVADAATGAQLARGLPAFAWAPTGATFAYTARGRVRIRDASGHERAIGFRAATPDRFGSGDLGWTAGDRLVFASSVKRNDREILVSRGGAPTPLTRNEVDDWAGSLAPDGSQIGFIRGSRPWLMRPDGAGAHAVGRARAQWAWWWPDATALVLDRSNALAVVELDGKRRMLLGWGDEWSADGTRLATLRAGVLRAGPTDGTLRRIGRGVVSYGLAPHGAAIAFQQGRRVYVRALPEGKPRLLARNAESPSWSHDGRWIAYQRQVATPTEKRGVWIVRPSGRGARSLGAGSNPVWSPDGRRTVWTSECKGGATDVGGATTVTDDPQVCLVVARADGSERRRFWSPLGWNVEELFWAPDSKRLVFRDEWNAFFDPEDGQPLRTIYVVDVERNTIRPLNSGHAHEGIGGWGPACTITGTAGRDRLRGTPGRDVICALGGDDVLAGLGGDDVLYGGNGDDRLEGGAGYDIHFGGAGADELRALDGRRDGVNGGPGRDRSATDRADTSAFVP